MPITRNRVDEDFAAFADQTCKDVEEQIIEVLCKIGAYGYDIAVEHGNFQDRTGELRSSIGWGVTRDGKLIKSGGFRQILQGWKGVEEGKAALRQMVADSHEGIALIFVAGAEYSIYVEAMGYDVITYSEQRCVEEAEKIINSMFK